MTDQTIGRTKVGRSDRAGWLGFGNVAAAAVLAAGCLTGVAATSLAVGSSPALADTVPPAPAGWTTVFGDNFAGAAGSAPSSANWFYDIGTGFGTGETEQTTNSTSNVFLDGNGHLVLKAIDNGGSWTSARIESAREDFQAPPGGELEMTASIEQPNPASGLGYWPAFWALGSPMRAGGGWPTSGEIDMMEDVNGSNQASQTLHDAANSPGHALIACPAAGSGCQTGYHTYSVIINRTNTSAESLEFLMDGTVESTITEASVGTTAWQEAIDHGFFIIFDLAMGGGFPNGVCGCTTPTSSTSSGGTMSVAYVAAYTTTGGGGGGTGANPTGPITGLGGLCVDVRGANSADFTPVQVYTCNGTNAQQWTVVAAGSTLHALGKCMDINGGGTADGTTVDLFTCNGTGAQVFIPQSNGALFNPQSGKCLDDTNFSTTPGTQLQIWDCSGNSNQSWHLP